MAVQVKVPARALDGSVRPMASAAATAANLLFYHVEQRKLEQLQQEFRSWLETKEDIVRLADRRDELLAVLNAKYGGYGAEDLEQPSFEAVNLSAQY
jgi:hypothetical protein